MLKRTRQTARKYRIATFNRMLNRNSICPANHSVGYHRGWYYFDEEPEQRPEITRKAMEHQQDPDVEVVFSPRYNSYVLQSRVHGGPVDVR